ncbi:MAG: cation:proton antiporter [Holophagales bacterium]|nr:cation:proton antiporter [Holophagales bacterium]
MDMFSVLIAAAAPPFLFDAVCVLLAGAVIAYLCSRLGLVPIVGFLAAGVVIGPNSLGLVSNPAMVDQAAELGVMLLLFTIGIELSLGKLARLKGAIFGGGGLQVALTVAGTVVLLGLLGVPIRDGIFTGFLLALSSTAIVLKLLADRGEASTPRGRIGVAILIFQDLGIIAMVLLLPSLAGQGGSALDIALALGQAGVLVVVVLLIARKVMPTVLEKVAATCSPEVFLLTVIAICLGTAYLTSLAGVSVSLGAFLAGLVVSESRFHHHALAEILPLQILFSAVFFVSVGMLLDPMALLRNLGQVLLLIAGIFVLKLVATAVAIRVLGRPPQVAVATALLLAQVGEFSFVLERSGRELGLVPFGMEGGSQIFIAATVVLMVLTPALAKVAAKVADRLAAKESEAEAQAEPAADSGKEHGLAGLDDHVILAGYGLSARRLAKVLQARGVPFGITTLSPAGAREAESLGMPVLRGDSVRAEILQAAGIERARLLVVADDEPAKAQTIAAVARGLNPTGRILVRTRSPHDTASLVEGGADGVAADELESTLWICGEVLGAYGVSDEEVRDHARQVRDMAARGELDAAPAGGATPKLLSSTEPARPPIRFDAEATITLEPRGSASCDHLDQLRPVVPSAAGCEECLESGDSWVHLRICMTCGHVGCCDSSANRHATAHHHASGHPIVRSLEPGETWGWCYVDEEEL